MLARTTSSHLQAKRYGDFTLTEAIRPSPDLTVVPRAGYRLALFRDAKSRFKIPMLCASVSSETLFDAFVYLLKPLGQVVHVILETSHDRRDGSHVDLLREGIDQPVLLSYCQEHEDLLMNDGCTGIAVLNEARTMEVQFDEHKTLTVYARDLKRFRRILRRFGLRRDDSLKLLSEAEHIHVSHPRYTEEFQQLCYHLGVGAEVEPVNW